MTLLSKKDKQLLLKAGVPIAVAAIAGVTAYMLWSRSAHSRKQHTKQPSIKVDTASINILSAAEVSVPVVDKATYSSTEGQPISSKSKKSRYVFMAILAILVMALVVLIVCLWQSRPLNADMEAASVERRIQPMGYVALDMSSNPVGGAEESAEDIVKTKCSVCHETGAGGAPKLRDTAEWRPRIRTGLDALVHSVLEGKGAMPPKGGFADLTEAQIHQAVIIMANESGANF